MDQENSLPEIKLFETKNQIHNRVIVLEGSKNWKSETCFNMALKWLEVGGYFLPSGFPPATEKKLMVALKTIKIAAAVAGSCLDD